jgi:beta-lactamase superfamily II metal-dependent hydrolase
MHVFPADHGDCLWVEHGTEENIRNVLVDAGTDRGGKRLIKYIKNKHGGKVHFDMFAVTHIDADHVAGALPLLQAKGIDVTFGDVWFNGYVHLKPDTFDPMGGVQGEKLTTLLLRKKLSWNGAFTGKAIRLTSAGKPQQARLKTGASITVLSSDEERLMRLEKNWKEECREAGLDPKRRRPRQIAPKGFERMGVVDVDALAESEFEEDISPSNGSSIGIVFEFEKKRIVLLGDACPSVVLNGLGALQSEGKFKADVVKLAHHGSAGNTNKELIQRVEAKSWVFSTSGAIFNHPDDEAVARIIKYASEPRLFFNYRTDNNNYWENKTLQKQKHYSTEYGDGVKPLTISLI